MRTYRDKEDLKNEIRQSFEKYISEFDTVPEALKDKRVPDVDRTPAENLAYQVGWTTLLLKWETDEKRGMDVKTPSEQFKWNQLGDLYQWFTDTYAHLSLAELKGKLNENIAAIQAMIDSMSEEELFQPHMRRWADDATKAAVWEVYKFIHVNTGAERDLACDGVFISVGRAPATELFQSELALDKAGYIIADESTRTNLPGVFAVGDVRTKALRQVVTAVSDGAVAVHYAEEYLAENR